MTTTAPPPYVRSFAPNAVSLRPVSPPDLAWIEQAAYATESSFRWRRRGATFGPEELNRNMWERVFAQYVVHAGAPIGLVQAYDIDLRNQHGWLSVLAIDSPQSATLCRAGVTEFVHGLFETAGIRKLFLYVLESQRSYLAEFLPEHPNMEGCLTEFELTTTGVEDLQILSWSAA